MNDQRSLTDQLADLLKHATSSGMYDAADWLQRNQPVIVDKVPWKCPTVEPRALKGWAKTAWAEGWRPPIGWAPKGK